MTIVALYLALGAGTGILAGLLGLGGGLIIVPALLWLWELQGLAFAQPMQLALGTSLATIVATSLSSLLAHHRRGAILWPTVRRLTPGIVAGALGGAAIAGMLPSHFLKRLFGIFELVVALQLVLNLRPAGRMHLPGAPALAAAGGVIGVISSFIGIGGGTLTVPYLLWCGATMRQAIASAAATGFPIALAGAAGYVLSGWRAPGLPAWSTGYVYWPALLSIIPASMLCAPVGARLAHVLPAEKLKRLFAIILALIGLKMLLA